MTSMNSSRKFATQLAGLVLMTGSLFGSTLFSLGPGSPIAVGTRPTGVATGDFNGDGKQDIAVANARDNTVTILLGNGSGGFTAAPGSPVAVGSFPYAILAKDLNKDGKMDLAVVNGVGNTVTILLGNGAGGFTQGPGSPVAVGVGPQYIATGDFNGDTIPDLAVTNYNAGTVTVLLGNGAGGFTQGPGSPFTTGGGPASVLTLDVNKDGKTDIAISDDIDDHVTILLGNGLGGFTLGSSNEGANHVSVLDGQANIYGMTSGDFLNRGITDVVTASFGTNEINFVKGDGAGNLIYNSQYTASTPLNVISGDFDGDGNLDVAAVVNNSQLLVLLGNGAGVFTPLSLISTGINPYGMATADFNGDGHLDLVVTNQNDYTISVFLGNVAAPVVPPVVPPVVAPATPSAQTIFFTVADHMGSDKPFALQATASSGLPVTFNIVSGPATLSGNMVTLTGLGTVTVQAAQAGNSFFAPATVAQSFNVTVGAPSIKSILNGASFSAGLVPTSYYATLFGSNLASGTSVGDANKTATLAGTTVTVMDSNKQTLAATLSFMSFGQINFVVPAGVASGAATVTVTNATGKTASVPVTIGALAPGVFSADGTGTGGAAADVITVASDGSQTVSSSSSCTPFLCSLAPIPLAPGTQVYLVLFGTGIRGRSGLAGVSVTLGGMPATVTYAGAQGTFAGLDQIDVLIPASMAGSGTVDVKLTVDGIAANTVKINLK